MARTRSAISAVRNLKKRDLKAGLAASLGAPSEAVFYDQVGMSRPSRSFYIKKGGKLHSLKAVTAWVLQQQYAMTKARDFHSYDAANRAAILGFKVMHKGARWVG